MTEIDVRQKVLAANAATAATRRMAAQRSAMSRR